jgi:pyruvate carboxylase
MKMEATITSSVSGIVKRLAVSKSAPVEAGDLILVVEPA